MKIGRLRIGRLGDWGKGAVVGSDLGDLRVFQAAETIAQLVWDVVLGWDGLARATIGEQLIRSTDSIGANIAEAYGRYHYGDKIRFLYIARGSLYETRFWLRQAYRRHLLNEPNVGQIREQLDALPLLLNNFINALKKQRRDNATNEERTEYEGKSEISQSHNLVISTETDDNPF